MDCHNCKNVGICKIYQMILDMKTTADISVVNCKACFDEYSISNQVQAQTASRAVRTSEELQAVTEKIRQLTVVSKASKIEEDEISQACDFICNVCYEVVNKEVICHICSKSVCSNCITESIEDGKLYCENCWDEL